jgi:hypothetical protein
MVGPENRVTLAMDHSSRLFAASLNPASAAHSKDDWYSRCGRLGGFGLTLPVPTNQNALADPVLRISTRGVKLLDMLGLKIGDPLHYPKMKYHATKEPVTVKDEIEERNLGDGWAESPSAFRTS